MVCKGSSQQRPDDRGDAVDGANATGVYGALNQGNRVRDDDQSPAEQAGRPQTSNSPTDDQSHRVWRNATEKRADLEDKQGDQEDPFNAEEAVKLAKEQLEGAGREEVCGAVPAHILDRTELVGDARDCSGDDRVVQSHAQNGQAKAEDDRRELHAARILHYGIVRRAQGSGPCGLLLLEYVFIVLVAGGVMRFEGGWVGGGRGTFFHLDFGRGLR